MNTAQRLERVVSELADGMAWNWTCCVSARHAADSALDLLVREGLIEEAEHPSGGKVWRVNNKLFGRTDGITHKKFYALAKPVKKGTK